MYSDAAGSQIKKFCATLRPGEWSSLLARSEGGSARLGLAPANFSRNPHAARKRTISFHLFSTRAFLVLMHIAPVRRSAISNQLPDKGIRLIKVHGVGRVIRARVWKGRRAMDMMWRGMKGIPLRIEEIKHEFQIVDRKSCPAHHAYGLVCRTIHWIWSN